jgi:cell division protein FtsN
MSARYWIAAMTLAAVSAPLSAQSVEEGVEAWQQGDYAEAVATWQPLAEGGDADAQYNLAQAYRIGRGTQQNATESRKWFELAAKQGQVDAQTALGLLLIQTADRAEALQWLKLAAEQNEPRALLVYGAALYKGDGVPRDATLGYNYVSKAAALGLKPAKDTLTQMDALNAAQQQAAVASAPEESAAPVAVASASTPAAPETTPEPLAKPEPVEVASVRPEPLKAPEPAPQPVANPVETAAKPVQTASLDVPRKAVPKTIKDRPAVGAPTGVSRVQLGAFAQKGNAEGLYQKLAGKGALVGRRAFYVAAGAVTKLQVGPFETRASAQSACNALASACIPVMGK